MLIASKKCWDKILILHIRYPLAGDKIPGKIGRAALLRLAFTDVIEKADAITILESSIFRVIKFHNDVL